MKVRLIINERGQFMLDFDTEQILINPESLMLAVQMMKLRGEREIELELTDSDIYSAYMNKVCGVVHANIT